jgi:hypothetical protein
MKKRLVSMILCVLLLITFSPAAMAGVNDFPKASIDAPANIGISVTSDDDTSIYSYTLGYSIPSSILALNDEWVSWSESNNADEMSINLEYDYKLNESGNWHYTTSWDLPDGALESIKQVDLGVNGTVYIKPDMLSDTSSKMNMLDTNTLYFRCRFTVTFHDNNNDVIVKSVSPWSGTTAIGKNANAAEIKIDPPVLTKVELKENDIGAPYFEVTNQISDAVKALDNSGGAINIQVDYRKNGGSWVTVTGYNRLISVFFVNPVIKGDGNDVIIDAGTYEIRARYGYGPVYGIVDKWSAYSNVLKIGSPAFYKGASKWAEPYLDRAAGYGFITDRVKDNLSGNITREEFAEIALRLYEKYTGIKAEVGSASFIDTTNPEILKAANLGLVSGVGHGKYAPKQLVTREQMTTILLNALKIIKPIADFSSTGSPKFADDKDFSGYARVSIYYCSKNSIVSGIGNNMFGSKRNSTREAAIIVCTKAYELYMK